MDFIRVDIVKDGDNNLEENNRYVTSKCEDKDHLEEDSCDLVGPGDTNLMSEDPPQSKCDYSFLEAIDLGEETPKEELLRMRKELDTLFEEID